MNLPKILRNCYFLLSSRTDLMNPAIPRNQALVKKGVNLSANEVFKLVLLAHIDSPTEYISVLESNCGLKSLNHSEWTKNWRGCDDTLVKKRFSVRTLHVRDRTYFGMISEAYVGMGEDAGGKMLGKPAQEYYQTDRKISQKWSSTILQLFVVFSLQNM